MIPAAIIVCAAFIHIGGQLMAGGGSTTDFSTGVVLSAVGVVALGLIYAVQSRGLER